MVGQVGVGAAGQHRQSGHRGRCRPARRRPGHAGTVLLNSGQQNFGPLSGGRVTVGGWLDQDRLFGVEGSGFLMESGASGFAVQSNANGSPLIAIPAAGTPPLFKTIQESAQIFSFPGAQRGGVDFSSTINLWGAEANGVVNVWNTDRLRLNLLAGFRYLDLAEQYEHG